VAFNLQPAQEVTRAGNRGARARRSQNRVAAWNAWKVGAISIPPPLSPTKISQLVGLLNKCVTGR
jgi:hypothetical protein